MATATAPHIKERSVLPVDPARFDALVPARSTRDSLRASNRRASELFEGRVLWSVSARSRSGGLVELLESETAYARGAGIDARWEVIGASDDFFRLVTRLHNNLHGEDGDEQRFGEAERALYEQTLRAQAQELSKRVAPGDVVVLHNPHTLPLIDAVKEAGAYVIWRCHVERTCRTTRPAGPGGSSIATPAVRTPTSSRGSSSSGRASTAPRRS